MVQIKYILAISHVSNTIYQNILLSVSLLISTWYKYVICTSGFAYCLFICIRLGIYTIVFAFDLLPIVYDAIKTTGYKKKKTPPTPYFANFSQ